MGFRERLANWISGGRTEQVSPLPVSDSTQGWSVLGNRVGINDRDWLEMQMAYTDALEAWRKNPQARRIISIITDHVIGDGLRPEAPGQMGRFIDQFWDHRQNNMSTRLPGMVDELSRSGDLFVVLFRNNADGMSYVRTIPKSQILRIDVAENDWETEIAYHEKQGPGEPPKVWLSPYHPNADVSDALMLHYAINRPVGALFGDGELTPVLPWLLRYSRMLEDRVRLNWAARVFYWFVKVPRNAVQTTAQKYRTPPEPGAIVVHDEGEEWMMQTPKLHAGDAANDLQSLRLMISAGSGQPPHWHGDSMDVNLATAQAMERTAMQHIRRRQREVADMLIEICHLAYSRAYGMGMTRRTPNRDQIVVELPDIDRKDNLATARAGSQLADSFATAMPLLSGNSRTLREKILRLMFVFLGERIGDDEANLILDEMEVAAEEQKREEERKLQQQMLMQQQIAQQQMAQQQQQQKKKGSNGADDEDGDGQ